MTWPNRTTIEFLNLYKQEPVIWDPVHVNNKNRTEVNEAWERIKNSFSIDCSVIELKKKKESLMATFRGIINKPRLNGSDNNTSTSSWFAFDTMLSFLGDIYRIKNNRRPENSIGSASYSDESKEATGEEELDNIFTETEPPIHNEVFLENSVDSAFPLDIKKEIEYPVEVKEEYGKRKLLDSGECSIEKPSKVSRSNCDPLETDECSQYIDLLSTKLKAFNKKDRIVLMHEIDNLIFKARIQSFQS